MKLLKLFDFQKEAVKSVIDWFKLKVNRQLIVLPTGTGKTIIMGAIANRLNKKTLILAHRDELIQQTYKKFSCFWPMLSIGIVKAKRNELKKKIVIGSVATCCQPKRLAQLKKMGFKVLIIDETHHAASDSYQRIIKELGFTKENNDKLLIGVTATPTRSDKKGLLETFDKVVFSRSIATMIKSGYLVPVFGRKILTSTSLDDVKIQNGDFQISDLSNAVNTSYRNNYIVSKYIEHANGRKAIAFCADVKHSQDLAFSFNEQGIKAAAIWGDMPPADRAKALQDLENGTITIATSCGVLIEGFDEPSINCVLMCRPTKSKPLYIQAVGRGLRKNGPLKTDCLVLDFQDQNHDLNSIVTLSATMPEAITEVDGIVKTFNQNENNDAISSDIIEIADHEFDLLSNAQFAWIDIGDNEYSLLADDNKSEIIISSFGNGYIADLYYQKETFVIVKTPLPLDYCTGVCEDFARNSLSTLYADMNGPWLKDNNKSSPSTSQINILRQNGIDDHNMNKVQASLAIRKIFALERKGIRNKTPKPISDKQKAFLAKYNVDTSNINSAQAMGLISRIIEEEQNVRK